MFIPNFVQTYYSSTSGIDIGKGTPSSLYVAMGLQEGPCGNGWYNQYVAITYGAANGDYDKANDMAKQDISKSLATFKQNPLYATKFFFGKTLSQWNEPSFQSLWMSDYWGNHSEEISQVTENIYRGTLNKIFLKIMDSVVLLIWLGNAIFYCRKQKTISIEQLLLGIVFLGGFIFHLFWEAKALYIMPYFILSIISGVQGIDFMFHKLSNWMKSYICKTVS